MYSVFESGQAVHAGNENSLPCLDQRSHLLGDGIIVAAETSMPCMSCRLSWLSCIEKPLAYNITILSSSSLIEVAYFLSSFGSNSPCLSRVTRADLHCLPLSLNELETTNCSLWKTPPPMQPAKYRKDG
jgi:hypothetical protein